MKLQILADKNNSNLRKESMHPNNYTPLMLATCLGKQKIVAKLV